MRSLLRLAPLLLAYLVAASPAAATPPHAGSVDRSFGHNGRVTLKFEGERITPAAVAVQPDGRIVVAGTIPGEQGTYPGEYAGRVVAMRFLPDGDLDPGFGDNGIARAGFSTPVRIQGLALQPDGALLLSGTTFGPDSQWMGAVVRLLPSGAVDEGFGSDGIARIPGGPGYPHDVNSLSEIGAQADGRIVAAGTQRAYDVHIPHDPYLIRLMPDGSPDPSFGGDGVSRQGTANPIAVLPRPSGDTVVVGWDEEYFGTTYLTVLGLGPNGRTVQQHYQHSYTAIAAAVRPDGTIDVVGELVNYVKPVRRFLAHTRVGKDLEILGQSKVRNSDLTAATFDARGAMLAARSWLYPYDPPPFRIERYRDMQKPDRSFGNRAGARDVFFARPGALTGLAMQGDKLIVAGYTYPRQHPSQGVSLTLVRLHARQDRSGPRLYLKSIPRNRCTRGPIALTIIARDESRVTTRVSIDHRLLAKSIGHRFGIGLDTTNLRAGRHTLHIHSTDAAGNRSAISHRLRVCS